MDIKRTLKRFAIRSALINGALGVVAIVLFKFFFADHYFHLIPAIFVFFYLLSLLVFRFLVKGHNATVSEFSQRFLIITSIKFFGSITIVVTFLIFAPKHAIPFIVIYIILYFASLFHEVSSFLHFTKRSSS